MSFNLTWHMSASPSNLTRLQVRDLGWLQAKIAALEKCSSGNGNRCGCGFSAAMPHFVQLRPTVADTATKRRTQRRFKFTARIAPANCTFIFTKRDKSCATIYQVQCKRTSLNYHFIGIKLYPLSKQGFCGSLKSRRSMRRVPQDGYAMPAKQPARHLAKFFAHDCTVSWQWRNNPVKHLSR